MFLKACVFVLLLVTLFAVGGTAAYGDRALGLVEGLAAERDDPYNQLMELRGGDSGGIGGPLVGVSLVVGLLVAVVVAYRFAAHETRHVVREVRLARRASSRARRPSAPSAARPPAGGGVP